jgi:hypothetical protein
MLGLSKNVFFNHFHLKIKEGINPLHAPLTKSKQGMLNGDFLKKIRPSVK